MQTLLSTFNEMIERIRSCYLLVYHESRATEGTFNHIGVKLTGGREKKISAKWSPRPASVFI